MKGVDEQIEMLYTSLKEEVTSYIGTLRNRMKIVNDQVALLEGRINFLTQRNIDLHKIFVEQQRLNSQEQVLEQSYQVSPRAARRRASPRRPRWTVSSPSASSDGRFCRCSRLFPGLR